MDGTQGQGVGRGGRGALLLAALRSQGRRPDREVFEKQQNVVPATSPNISNNNSIETLASGGRGIYLQSLLQKNDGMPLQIPGRGACVSPTSTLAFQNGNKIYQRESVSPFKEKEEICNIPFGRGFSPIQNIPVPKVVVPNVGRGISELRLEASPVQSNAASSKSENVSPSPESSMLSIKSHSGTSGKPINLEVNYVRLNTKKGAGVYEYYVSFEPMVDSRNMRFKLLNQQNVKDLIGNIKTFDGSKLYLPVRLPMSNVKVVTSMPTDGSSVNVFIKFISVCQAKDCLHLYNVLFRKIMYILKMTPVGRNYFDPYSGITVAQHKLEIWPGYITAVQEYEGGVMLNCDASFRVLRTVTVRDVICELSSTRGEMKDAVAKAILGNIVLTRYNNKTYRIDDIDWNLNPKSSFATKSGKSITFKDYYKQSYDIDIKDDGQPLLISKPKKKPGETSSDKLLCLIPELSYMTGLTDTMRSDFKVMKDIAAHTRVTPSTRQHALRKFIANVNSCPEAKQTLLDWNLEIDSAVVSLDGRQLPIEEISMAKNGFPAGNEGDWGRNISRDHVIVPVHLVNWVVVCTRHDMGKVNEFISMMNKVCPSIGITMRNPHMSVITNDRTESYRNAIKEVVNPTIQIVVIIFPTPRDDRYNAVKKLCCVEMPVPSQVINVKTISDYTKLRSVTQKIALQMNCKLGGELWSLRIPLSNVMICGLDSYHDATNRKQSVLGFVASINSAITRWFSMTTFQNRGQELGDSLKILLTGSLKKYYEVNHRLPDKIVLYRDGVGDGLLDVVAQYEAEQFKSCFKHFGSDYSPTLSVIVVQKRINTRMYLALGANKNDVRNPPPGSVLDHTVTRKKWYDFFLVSQHVRQGTVSPTHYVVVHDSSTLKPDHMQRLAYKMTHLYYNWPGTVRVPAPCQYAHKLAYLVGENLHKAPHPDLGDKLFYL